MNKFVLMLVIVAVVALGSVGIAYAQSPTQAPGTGSGYMSGQGTRGGLAAGDGLLHEYFVAAYAEKLAIPVADLEARLESGETMSQVALSTGLTIDEFRTLMVEVRALVVEQALNDGVLTQAQADWMSQRGSGQMGGRMGGGLGMRASGQGQFANPDCPYYQTNP
jgi:hypothetical protein